jgi:hypothetical protein
VPAFGVLQAVGSDQGAVQFNRQGNPEGVGAVKRTIKAIPTVYSGIQLKSRMEAQCAVLFDKLGWDWKYEPFSLMLPGGTTYIPDFWVSTYGGCMVAVECRGYTTKRGVKQIDKFAFLAEDPEQSFIMPDGENLSAFLVIGPDRVGLYDTPMDSFEGDLRHVPVSQRRPIWSIPPIIFHCECGWGLDQLSRCVNCDSDTDAALVISVKQGKLFINGYTVEDFEVPVAEL